MSSMKNLAVILACHQGKGTIALVLVIARQNVEIGNLRDPRKLRSLARLGPGHAGSEKALVGEDPIIMGTGRHLVERGVHADCDAEQGEGHHHRQQGQDGADGLAHYRGPDQGQESHAVAPARSIKVPLSISSNRLA